MIKRIHSTLLLCKDINKTSEFYKQLGFSIKISDDSIRLILGDYRLTFIDENISTLEDDINAKKGVGMFIFFEVEDVDSFYQTLKQSNVNPLSEPAGRTGGKRRFTVVDPDGYKLVFFTESK